MQGDDVDAGGEIGNDNEGLVSDCATADDEDGDDDEVRNIGMINKIIKTTVV